MLKALKNDLPFFGMIAAIALAQWMTHEYRKPMVCHREVDIAITGHFALYDKCSNRVRYEEHFLFYLDGTK